MPGEQTDPHTRAGVASLTWLAPWFTVVVIVVGFVVSPTIGQTDESTKVDIGHRVHIDKLAMECTGCHPGNVSANVNRPAALDHSSCDSKECHANDFYKLEGNSSLCRTCHVHDKMWMDMAKLHPFPARSVGDRDFYTEFNHQAHMDPKRAVEMKQDPLACVSCHKITPNDSGKEAYVDNPRHADCATCHQEGSSIPMSACETCHEWRKNPDGTVREIAPELEKNKARVTQKFQHETHRLDRRKKEPTVVSCGVCHGKAAEATKVREIVLVEGRRTMEKICRDCHRPGQKTRDGKAIFSTRGTSCKKCHSKKFLKQYYSLGLPKSH